MEIVKLTLVAQKQAKTLLGKEKDPKEGLRVSVIGGGCSGLRYELGWDDPRESDHIHSYENGLTVFIDEKSALYLTGASLEYYEDIGKTGFEIVNPNANSTCGCGESFSA